MEFYCTGEDDSYGIVNRKIVHRGSVSDENDPSQQNLDFETHWQGKASGLSEEVSKLVVQADGLRKEKEKDSEIISSLKQEIDFLTNKMAAMVVEQRETRNHWLYEKTELEGRFFQIQALNTQVQGTLRKKEKDYEKLQTQLEKVVKDSNRGQKSVMMVSKPLAKNSSQAKPTTGTLKDAELMASKTVITSLETENDQLREALDQLIAQNEEIRGEASGHLDRIEELQAELADARAAAAVVEETATAATAAPSFISPEKNRSFAGAADVDAEREAIYLLQSAAKRAQLVHGNKVGGAGAPQTPLSVRRGGDDGTTPSARPISWTVAQANTEVKRLRSRAEQLLHGTAVSAAAADVAGGGGSLSAMLKGGGGGRKTADEYTRAQLLEAIALIHEQDRLIHHALMGRLPGLVDHDDDNDYSSSPFPSSSRSTAGMTSPLPTSTYISSGGGYYNGLLGSTTKKAMTSAYNNNINEDKVCSPFLIDDADCFPPASPATLELLQSYGWSNVPRMASPVPSPRPPTHATAATGSAGTATTSALPPQPPGDDDVTRRTLAAGDL